MQPILVKVALYSWSLVVLVLFRKFPPHRALIISVLAGIMFLPEVQISKVSGEAPDAYEFVLLILKFTKPNAIAFAALLGVLIFDTKRLLTFRPRWYDLPMLAWCVGTYFSNTSNGVGPYDSFAMMRDKTLMWGVPYFLGRLYFNNLDNFRELAIGIVIAGLVYAPLCLFESRFFPQLHEDFYGFFPGARNEVFRMGGYRPVVFMSHGIMLGLWMVATTVVGFWLWWTGAVTELSIWPFRRPLPMKWLMLFLGLTTAWVRSTGAMGIGAACLLGTAQMRWFRFPVILLALLVVSPVYLYYRTTGWNGESFVETLTALGAEEDRVNSLAYRLHMENRLILHYQRKPEFGWGDHKEDWRQGPKFTAYHNPLFIRLAREHNDGLAVADAMWVITVAQYGQYGLIAVWVTMLLPVVRFMIVHPPGTWFQPTLAPPAAAALVLIMSMNDNLLNGFYNPVFVMSAGALLSVTGIRVPRQVAIAEEPQREEAPTQDAPALPQGRPGVLVRNRALR
jgi:hypothetical protein